MENINIKSRTDEELGDLTYYLSQYNFKIKYAPGKNNLEADCLSRNPVLEPDENMDEQLKIVNLIKLKDILEDQEKNEDIQRRKDRLISKHDVYYKKVKKKEKIILSEIQHGFYQKYTWKPMPYRNKANTQENWPFLYSKESNKEHKENL